MADGLPVAVHPAAADRRGVLESDRLVVGILGIGLGWAFLQLLVAPDMVARATVDAVLDDRPGRMLVAAAGIVAATGLRSRAPLGRWHMPVLVGLFVALGAWVVASTPDPFIDVFTFQHDASLRLAALGNPYAMDFPNLYGSTNVYAPEAMANGRLLFGFPYPPLSLFLSAPAQLLLGDPRYAQVAAIAGAAALVAWSRPGRVARSAAALLLFASVMPYLIEYAWTEPFAVLLLAAVVASACRAPRVTGVVLGLFLVVKQYLVLAVPLTLLLLPIGAGRQALRRLLVPALIVGALVTTPLALLDAPAFLHSVVMLQFQQPYRPDSLGYGPIVAGRSGMIPLWVPVAGYLAMLVLSLWRAPRTPAGFAASVAICTFVFFAFSKQAFPNYYLLVLGGMCVAIAAARPPASSPEATAG